MRGGNLDGTFSNCARSFGYCKVFCEKVWCIRSKQNRRERGRAKLDIFSQGDVNYIAESVFMRSFSQPI
jgi:hypothetical protein